MLICSYVDLGRCCNIFFQRKRQWKEKAPLSILLMRDDCVDIVGNKMIDPLLAHVSFRLKPSKIQSVPDVPQSLGWNTGRQPAKPPPAFFLSSQERIISRLTGDWVVATLEQCPKTQQWTEIVEPLSFPSCVDVLRLLYAHCPFYWTVYCCWIEPSPTIPAEAARITCSPIFRRIPLRPNSIRK